MKLQSTGSSSAGLVQNGQNWSLSLPMEPSFVLFETAIGTCAIAWGSRGIVGLSLPAGNSDTPRAGIAKRFPDVAERQPEPEIETVVLDIQALLAGEARDLLGATLDFDGIPDFHRRVYEVTRAIPPGQTLTYGQVSDRLKAPGTSRAVGQALGANPFPIIVPCHRILAASGKAGGFSAPGGLDTKLKMLNIERVHAEGEQGLFGSLPLAIPPGRWRTIPNSRRRQS